MGASPVQGAPQALVLEVFSYGLHLLGQAIGIDLTTMPFYVAGEPSSRWFEVIAQQDIHLWPLPESKTYQRYMFEDNINNAASKRLDIR